jgi:hypothetical protein
MGYGAKTGWGAGLCTSSSGAEDLNQASGRDLVRGFGRGFGRGRGFGGGVRMRRRAARGGFFGPGTPQTERSHLENQLETLQNQLSAVKQRLETLKTKEPQDN